MWLVLGLLVSSAADVPNFVVFFADDMGAGDTSLSGHPTLSTPNIDRLALEGLRFTQWYSGFHVCSPSRASMMTGRLPIRAGVTGDWTGGVFSSVAVAGLPLNETTWAQTLKAEGYRTMAVGKWHLGQRPEYLPTRRGFDEYLGIPYSVDMGRSAWRLDTTQPPLPLLANETVLEQPVNLNTLSQRYVDAAEAFVLDEGRFALYYAFSHVHVPDFASPQFCNASRRGLFGDAIAEMDWSLGQVKARTPRNTLTFFTSDNGPWLIERLKGGSAGLFFEGKQTTWEGGVREPAIIHWPGVIEPGGIRRALTATYDIFATILGAAGIAPPDDRVIDGVDLRPLFARDGQVRDCVFIYKGRPDSCGGDDDYPSCPGLWAVRCGPYKAHFATSYTAGTCQGAHNVSRIGSSCTAPVVLDTPLLFNVEVDPSEKWPIDATSDEYQTALATILAAKTAHETELGEPPRDQILLGSNIDYAVCGCPESQASLPQWPNCTCNPENWLLAVCAPPNGDSPYAYVDDLGLLEEKNEEEEPVPILEDTVRHADYFEATHGWRPY
ncbi:hypothetical protein CTAYLR_000219 [Chrysophaeum taylorii]|uniref:Sulfatase N-terminal domain-containing protein n=1 Tax=Chrysophaeum taylorii TaxID=2483200 RepID=A0AAD7XMC0_9STRA|nr:hypothetical protein CTAYLR_000219 [Chrysophaeum taylorii]